MKLIMPMAGDGTRFKQQGYTDPKPLINVKGKPMFVQAVENIGLEFDDYIFIVRKEHDIKKQVLNYYPTAKVVELEGLTEGAACSVLTADQYLNDNDSIFVSNCDQIIDWDSAQFNKDNDGVILTFDCPSKDPKWSFAQVNKDGNVVRVAEKDPISALATTGHYFWNSWKLFKESAQTMIDTNDRFNNEFYLCPVFNYTKGIIKTCHVNKMHGIGTPEDLTAWLSL
jgi:dTDP-glucose pyrophosphorylase